MEPSERMMTSFFALFIVIAYIVMVVFYINPILSKNYMTLDDAIAMYIDTLASVEVGTAKIPVEKMTVKNVIILYETEGQKDGYEIDEEGWYVVSTYPLLFKSEKSASKINRYPADAKMEKRLLSPEMICIIKREGIPYPEVGETC